MNMIKIVADSSTLYTRAEAEKIGLHSVPLNVTIDNKSYQDLEDITSDELIQMINEHKIPRTSQPSLGEKIDIYNELLSEGNEVIDITMAAGLSGTYHTALMAKDQCITLSSVFSCAFFLFMIRLSIDNAITSVNLLQQNDAHKLMRKCHFGKTECIVGTP